MKPALDCSDPSPTEQWLDCNKKLDSSASAASTTRLPAVSAIGQTVGGGLVQENPAAATSCSDIVLV